MSWTLWLLMVPLLGEPEFVQVGLEPMTRQECLAVARYERVRRAYNPWPGKTFVWCDPESGWPAHR